MSDELMRTPSQVLLHIHCNVSEGFRRQITDLTSLIRPTIPAQKVSVPPRDSSGKRAKMLYFDGLTQTATARIYTQTGQRILTTPMRHSLNVSHLTTGIYMVSLTHKRTITTQKLIKK